MEELPDATVVASLLQSAGLTVSEEELDRLVWAYPILRAQADGLYELDADADAEPDEELPALVFDPSRGFR